jgi:nucleolar protein 4
VLHGRTLDVVRAVTRDVAGKLKEDGEKQREKADKRNMYLLREGGESSQIFVSPAII